MDPKSEYLRMQKEVYEKLALQSSYETPEYAARDDMEFVVGSYAAHEKFNYEKLLFYRLDETESKIALEYGCGPGRMVKRLSSLFKRVDGVDISAEILKQARRHCGGIPSAPKFYLTEGQNIAIIGDATYDVVYSVICLQHICVYTIRQTIIREIFRVLKDGGFFTFQMGYGTGHEKMIGYYEDYTEADSTNGAYDVSVLHPYEIVKDLVDTGFSDIRYIIRPTGPGDVHSCWIFVSAIKSRERNGEIGDCLGDEHLEELAKEYKNYMRTLSTHGIQAHCNSLQVSISKLTDTVAALHGELSSLRNSYSFKIGRTLTFPFRKMRELLSGEKRL